MQLEFHQLDRRWEQLRVRHPSRQRRLLASLADSGQQTPIVVVAAEGQADRYVVIDGYKRIVGAGATGPGHSGSGGVADERVRGRAAGPLATLVGTGDRVRGGLAAGGVGAAFRLWTR